MADDTSPSSARGIHAPYKADPYEARTDLLLDGFWFAKILCAAALYFAVMFAAARLSFWVSLLLFGASAAAALVAIDRLQNLAAIRRGRAGRSLAAFGKQVANIVRRFWFLPLIPLLDPLGLSFWPGLVLMSVVVCVIEAGLERLQKAGVLPPWLGLAAASRGAPDTAPGKGATPP